MNQLNFDGYSSEAILEVLNANCVTTEVKGYMRQFTPEEIADLKSNLAETSISLSDKMLQKKEQDNIFKEEVKPLNIRKELLLKQIKQRSEFIEEECFVMHDEINSSVEFYNPQGVCIETRPMRPDEKQTRLEFNPAKTGTHN